MLLGADDVVPHRLVPALKWPTDRDPGGRETDTTREQHRERQQRDEQQNQQRRPDRRWLMVVDEERGYQTSETARQQNSSQGKEWGRTIDRHGFQRRR